MHIVRGSVHRGVAEWSGWSHRGVQEIERGTSARGLLRPRPRLSSLPSLLHGATVFRNDLSP